MVIVRQDGTQRIYVDGINQGDQTNTRNLEVTSDQQDFKEGCQQNGANIENYFTGLIDDLTLYDTRF